MTGVGENALKSLMRKLSSPWSDKKKPCRYFGTGYFVDPERCDLPSSRIKPLEDVLNMPSVESVYEELHRILIPHHGRWHEGQLCLGDISLITGLGEWFWCHADSLFFWLTPLADMADVKLISPTLITSQSETLRSINTPFVHKEFPLRSMSSLTGTTEATRTAYNRVIMILLVFRIRIR